MRKGECIRAVPIRSALVIDDHPLYCDALVSVMHSAFDLRRIRKAATVAEALAVLRSRFVPDVVLLDLNLPDVSGLSGFIKIKDRAPDVPVVVISATSSVDVIHTVMEAGAAGFIPKDAARETLCDAMRAIWDGKTYVPPGLGPATPRPEKESAATEMARRVAGLSQQQTRILSLICKGKPNKLIAYDMQLAEATVKAHITALLRRLGVRNRTQAALLVRETSILSHLQ